jgi:hypothetical protein
VNWRPKDWENPFKSLDRDRELPSIGRLNRAYEAGADAMLVALSQLNSSVLLARVKDAKK